MEDNFRFVYKGNPVAVTLWYTNSDVSWYETINVFTQVYIYIYILFYFSLSRDLI